MKLIHEPPFLIHHRQNSSINIHLLFNTWNSSIIIHFSSIINVLEDFQEFFFNNGPYEIFFQLGPKTTINKSDPQVLCLIVQ